MPPSNWYDRVVDELLNLLPDDSSKATTRMRYVLMLVPDDYDYTQDRIISEGVKRVLRFETETIFKKINLPGKKPIRLVMGSKSPVCNQVRKPDATYEIYFNVPGTKIIYADGTASEPGDTSHHFSRAEHPYANSGLWRDVGRATPNPSNVTKFMQKDVQRWRSLVFEAANWRFEWEKKQYAKSLDNLLEKKGDVEKAGQLLDQLSVLSGDSKWVAEKSRIYNDMIRALERANT